MTLTRPSNGQTIDASHIDQFVDLYKGGQVFDAIYGYGADPTGSADSTTPILNAVGAAVSAGGGIVDIGPGTFKTSATIAHASPNVWIRGAGVGVTKIAPTTAAFDTIRLGNRQTDGIMRNWMALTDMTVTMPGGASTKAGVVVDGGGYGTTVQRVECFQGANGFRFTDLDRCYMIGLQAQNQRSNGILCEVGLENTWGTVDFISCHVVVSDTNGVGWMFDKNADQASPNAFDRIGIFGTLFYASVGVSGSVGLQANVGITSLVIQNSLFENPIFHVILNGQSNPKFMSCTFLQNSGNSTDCIQMNTNPHLVTVDTCRFQQSVNVFHAVSGNPKVCLLGFNNNQGNLTNIFNGSFGFKTGTDTVFAGDNNLAFGLNNQHFDYVFANKFVASSGSGFHVRNAADNADNLVVSDGGSITYNHDLRRSKQSPAFNAAPAPDPTLGEIYEMAALTGAVSVANPVNAAQGQRIRFYWKQDGSGGRTVTYSGTNFRAVGIAAQTTTLNTYTIDEAECLDGTIWRVVRLVTGQTV